MRLPKKHQHGSQRRAFGTIWALLGALRVAKGPKGRPRPPNWRQLGNRKLETIVSNCWLANKHQTHGTYIIHIYIWPWAICPNSYVTFPKKYRNGRWEIDLRHVWQMTVQVECVSRPSDHQTVRPTVRLPDHLEASISINSHTGQLLGAYVFQHLLFWIRNFLLDT